MKTTVISLVLVLIIASNLCSQGIPYNMEFQVSRLSSKSIHLFPSVSGLTNDRFAICWQYFCSGVDNKVWYQLFDESGTKIGTEVKISDGVGAYHFKMGRVTPAIAGLSNGGFVVCWNNVLGALYGELNSIFGQIYDAKGAKTGNEFLVGTYLVYLQICPAVVCLPQDRLLVCYSAEGGEASGINYGIYGQFFDKFGARQSFEFVINTYNQDNQDRQTVSNLADGGFVVCWQSQGQDSSGFGIFGQLYDNTNTKKGDEFQVNSSIQNDQMYPSVACLDDNEFVVCWQSQGQDGSGFGIFGQLYDNAGKRKGNEFQANTYAQNNQIYPSVAGLHNGIFVVCWESEGQDGSGFGIFGQFFKGSGIKIGNEFQINTYNQGDQRNLSIACLSNKDFVICWTSQKGDSIGIFGKRFPKLMIHQLCDYSLLKPLYDATLNTKYPNFIWQQASKIKENYPWEVTYDLYIDTDPNFPNPKIIKNIQDTTYTIDSLAAGKTYFWKVLAKNLAGDSLWSKQQDWGFFIKPGATLVETAEQNLPTGFELFQNYPNPFNSSTEIRYILPSEKASYQVQLKVYDVLGRLVKVLVDLEQAAGTYAINWDGTDLGGNRAASGVYFYSLEAGSLKSIRKILVLQ